VSLGAAATWQPQRQVSPAQLPHEQKSLIELFMAHSSLGWLGDGHCMSDDHILADLRRCGLNPGAELLERIC